MSLRNVAKAVGKQIKDNHQNLNAGYSTYYGQGQQVSPSKQHKQNPEDKKQIGQNLKMAGFL